MHISKPNKQIVMNQNKVFQEKKQEVFGNYYHSEQKF